MNDFIFASSRDMLLYTVPLIAALVVSLLRIDVFFFARSKSPKELPNKLQRKAMRSGMNTDPDGRPWEA
jgi:hypothetical protein